MLLCGLMLVAAAPAFADNSPKMDPWRLSNCLVLGGINVDNYIACTGAPRDEAEKTVEELLSFQARMMKAYEAAQQKGLLDPDKFMKQMQQPAE